MERKIELPLAKRVCDSFFRYERVCDSEKERMKEEIEIGGFGISEEKTLRIAA